MSTLGKAYMAPSMGWQEMPSISLSFFETRRAFRFSAVRVSCRSLSNRAREAEPSVGRDTMLAMSACPSTLLQRLIDASLYICSMMQGETLWQCTKPPRSPHSPVTPFEAEWKENTSTLVPISTASLRNERNSFPSAWMLSWYTSSANRSSFSRSANARTCSMASRDSTWPVGLPGLITAIARGSPPCFRKLEMDSSSSLRLMLQLFSSSRKYPTDWPPRSVIVAL
mmetsp:Transcript_32370/g.85490  ORF Transcript_32370/g.85490 Transcript_32370/m.85490 type:complete len:226 (+) Transcript_32370:323-1000(+)